MMADFAKRIGDAVVIYQQYHHMSICIEIGQQPLLIKEILLSSAEKHHTHLPFEHQ